MDQVDRRNGGRRGASLPVFLSTDQGMEMKRRTGGFSLKTPDPSLEFGTLGRWRRNHPVMENGKMGRQGECRILGDQLGKKDLQGSCRRRKSDSDGFDQLSM
jgi:hypothetical protein